MSILKYVARTLRRFVFFALAMFGLGMAYGQLIPVISTKFGILPLWLTIIPIVLAIVSYYVTEVAVVIFLLLIGVFLIAFL